jgi:hypothetical protein
VAPVTRVSTVTPSGDGLGKSENGYVASPLSAINSRVKSAVMKLGRSTVAPGVIWLGKVEVSFSSLCVGSSSALILS